MYSSQIIFVSTLNENRASHRFRVVKLLQPLHDAGIRASVLRFHPSFELVALPRLVARILRHHRTPTVVVFQKTMAFQLARAARQAGALLAADLDDNPWHRVDGTPYPPDIRDYVNQWLQLMDGVIAGSRELWSIIKPHVENTWLIPTCLDVENYSQLTRPSNGRCVVGWIGSSETDTLLQPALPALRALSRSGACEVLIVGSRDPGIENEPGIQFLPWRLAYEPGIFSRMHIGIMPLPFNSFTLMKGGFKLLQYMAAGLPVVTTPLGINSALVRDGWNGFLALSSTEWQHALERLIADPALRERMGENGRIFVQEYRLEKAAALWRHFCGQLVEIRHNSAR